MSDDVTAETRVWRIFGFAIKAEISIGTLVAIGSAITAALGTVFAVSSTVIEVHNIRSEIGSPNGPNYIPGIVKGLRKDVTGLQVQMKQNHDDTAATLMDIKSAVTSQGQEASKRFDRLDGRIDRLVESGAVTHRPR